MPLYAFDGTWNDSSSKDRDVKLDTNVYRFERLYSERSHYIPGIGTRYGRIGRLVGGATGYGATARVEEQFENLSKEIRAGNTLSLIHI